ncbi:hypothetical protein [Mucilaginibacter sp.]|nr:hypothetical protein [Mucilaginibacter sp.]
MTGHTAGMSRQFDGACRYAFVLFGQRGNYACKRSFLFQPGAIRF